MHIFNIEAENYKGDDFYLSYIATKLGPMAMKGKKALHSKRTFISVKRRCLFTMKTLHAWTDSC